MLFYFEKVDLRINGPFHNCEVLVYKMKMEIVSGKHGL